MNSVTKKFYICLIYRGEFTEACNCEVSGWTQWSTSCSHTCGMGKISRSRVCSEKNGWTLGWSCHEKDEHKVSEHIDCNTQKCRKY